jgi:hypothetical protein
VKLLKERLREEIDRLMVIYGIGEHEYIAFRQVKIDLTEDIKQILRKQGAADNTPIDIYMEDTTLVVRVGTFDYRWN